MNDNNALSGKLRLIPGTTELFPAALDQINRTPRASCDTACRVGLMGWLGAVHSNMSYKELANLAEMADSLRRDPPRPKRGLHLVLQ